MRKGINLQAQLHTGGQDTSALSEEFQSAFARVNPDLQLKIRGITPPADGAGIAKVRLYIEGDQDPAADFAAFTRGALQKAIAAMQPDITTGKPTGGVKAAAAPALHSVEEVDDTADEDYLAKQQAQTHENEAPAPSDSGSSPAEERDHTTGAATPSNPAAPTPQVTAYQGQSTKQKSQQPWWAFWKR